MICCKAKKKKPNPPNISPQKPTNQSQFSEPVQNFKQKSPEKIEIKHNQ